MSLLTNLFRAIGEGSAFESISLKAIFVACFLLLQKPHRSSKIKDHITQLKCRLTLWQNGNIEQLASEGHAIQDRLPRHSLQPSDTQLTHSFSNLMFEGKTSAALKLITGLHRGEIL